MNTSIPRSTAIDFVNIQPLNPLISRCEIKVLYAGANRNRSFISKEVANKIANSLPGTPIIGQYLSEEKDFGDHGEDELIIDDSGVRFVKDTVPYGFVPTDAKVWWAEFLDKDGITREYMVTEGYLWTGRYPEAVRVVEEGNHQSMEFDRNTLVGEWSKIEGEWSKLENEDREYFIVSDATFSGLCILGQDVEPCFEGANITKNSNLVYSLNKDDFKEQMLDFMEDLKVALNNFSYEGGNEMSIVENNTNIETPVIETPVVEEPVVVEEETVVEEPIVVEEDFAKKKQEDDEDEDMDDSEDEDKDSDDEEDDEDKKKKKKEFAKKPEDEEEEKKKKCGYSLEEVVEYQELLEKFNDLEAKYSAIETELNSIKPEYSKLKEIQIEAENKAKDDMIGSFYMLSDEDKKDVVENKNKYSLEEIEAKLSVICVRNKVNFNLDDSSETESNTETPITTFNVDNTFDSTPAWIKAVERVAQNRR